MRPTIRQGHRPDQLGLGGSVGTLCFVNEYEDGRIAPSTKLSDIVDRAEWSSIDEISWGVLYPDLLRSIVSIPIPWGWDRGERSKRPG